MRLSGTIFSNVLQKDTGITIITPNDLSKQKQYKVAYVLHGLCGNSKTWLDYRRIAFNLQKYFFYFFSQRRHHYIR